MAGQEIRGGNPLTLDEYQEAARATAVYPTGDATIPPGMYPALGLAGEAGEVAEKIKKYWRDGLDFVETQRALVKELGDVLWYVSQLARDWDISLEYVAEQNLAKLADRKSRGVLKGSGDDR